MKFEHKDILILGDSFAVHRSLLTDWPLLVLNYQPGLQELAL